MTDEERERAQVMLRVHRRFVAVATYEAELAGTVKRSAGTMDTRLRVAHRDQERVALAAAEWHGGRAKTLAQELNEETPQELNEETQ